MSPEQPDAPDPAVAESLGLDQDGHRRRRWPFVVGGLVVVAGVAAVLLRPAPVDQRYSYTTAPVTRGDLTVQVTAVGTLEPLHTVTVASDVSGTVAEVLVESNDRVTAGQVLARLDTDLLAAQLRQAKAQRTAAQAGLRQARVAVDAAAQERARAEKLHAASAVSDAQLEAAVSAHDQAKAAVDVAAAQLAQAEAAADAAATNLDKATITSPIDGVVLTRSVEPGQAVVSALQAAAMFEVAEDLARMSVDVEIDEADVGRVTVGQTADFTVPAYSDRVFPAAVHKVELAPKPAAAVVTYIACLHLDNVDDLLRPGMTATARIATEQHEDGLLLPTAALRWSPPDEIAAAAPPPPEARDGVRLERVWLQTDEGPQPVEVVVRATDGRQVLVEEGDAASGAGQLAEGAAVITASERRKGGRGATP